MGEGAEIIAKCGDSNLEISLGSLISELREPHWSDRGKIIRVRDNWGYQENMTHWINWAELIWTHRLKQQAWSLCRSAPGAPCNVIGPVVVCTRSSAYVLWLIAWYFCETPNNGGRFVSDSLTCFWNSFPPIFPCLVHPPYEGFHLVLLCIVLLCLVVVFQRPVPFWKKTEGK